MLEVINDSLKTYKQGVLSQALTPSAPNKIFHFLLFIFLKNRIKIFV